MDILKKIAEVKKREGQLYWEGNIIDYLKIIKKNPAVAQTAHARLYDMIKGQGITTSPEGEAKYNFFSAKLFGLEDTINRLMDDYFHPSAKRLDVKKRILLLMGPVGGGKSTITNLIKKGLEEYTKTDDGAVYGIKGCPMHEDPLHLIPKELRDEVEKEYGIKIEGDLCPLCQLRLEEEYQGQLDKMKIERIFFSEEKRVGIGTFFPSDPKSQDIADLTGSIDFSTITKYGSESDPRAYRFDGELNKANRGVMEFQEMLKTDEKFLWNLLSLTQEGNFKAGRFALISGDEVIIAHTNEAEYQSFSSNKKNESLQSRIVVMPVPYNLKVSEEEKIYKKLIEDSDLTDIHIAPHTLNTVAIFSILTRLREPKNQRVDLLTKLELYNSEEVDDFNQADYAELKNEYSDEGMFGIDPRFIFNCISNALIKGEKKCVGALDVLESLRAGLEHNLQITGSKKEEYFRFISIAREEYDSNVKKDLQSIFSAYFINIKSDLMDKYIENIDNFLNHPDRKVDERLLRAIEEDVGVPEIAKYAFRDELMFKTKAYKEKGKELDFLNVSQFRESIEKRLYSDLNEALKLSNLNETVNRKLINEYGYCPICAEKLLAQQNSSLSSYEGKKYE